MYIKALPKSSGGTVMPNDSTQKEGGGKVNNKGKDDKVSKEVKDAVKNATIGTEAAGKMVNTSFLNETIPSKVDTPISWNQGGITGVGLDQPAINAIMQELGHGVVQIFYR